MVRMNIRSCWFWLSFFEDCMLESYHPFFPRATFDISKHNNPLGYYEIDTKTTKHGVLTLPKIEVACIDFSYQSVFGSSPELLEPVWSKTGIAVPSRFRRACTLWSFASFIMVERWYIIQWHLQVFRPLGQEYHRYPTTPLRYLHKRGEARFPRCFLRGKVPTNGTLHMNVRKVLEVVFQNAINAKGIIPLSSRASLAQRWDVDLE